MVSDEHQELKQFVSSVCCYCVKVIQAAAADMVAVAVEAMAIKTEWEEEEEAGDFKARKFYREHHPFETRV